MIFGSAVGVDCSLMGSAPVVDARGMVNGRPPGFRAESLTLHTAQVEQTRGGAIVARDPSVATPCLDGWCLQDALRVLALAFLEVIAEAVHVVTELLGDFGPDCADLVDQWVRAGNISIRFLHGQSPLRMSGVRI